MTKREMNTIKDAVSEMSKSELLDTLQSIIYAYSDYADNVTLNEYNDYENNFKDDDENTFFHSLCDTLMNFETALDVRELDIDDL